jgi:hypothetical protein
LLFFAVFLPVKLQVLKRKTVDFQAQILHPAAKLKLQKRTTEYLQKKTYIITPHISNLSNKNGSIAG